MTRYFVLLAVYEAAISQDDVRFHAPGADVDLQRLFPARYRFVRGQGAEGKQ